MSHCWQCGQKVEEYLGNKVPFRATCDHCAAALHCCQNCKHYKVGLPNDCMVPGTEWVSDRRASNLCEEFSLLGVKRPPPDASGKKKFEDLFK